MNITHFSSAAYVLVLMLPGLSVGAGCLQADLQLIDWRGFWIWGTNRFSQNNQQNL